MSRRPALVSCCSCALMAMLEPAIANCQCGRRGVAAHMTSSRNPWTLGTLIQCPRQQQYYPRHHFCLLLLEPWWRILGVAL